MPVPHLALKTRSMKFLKYVITVPLLKKYIALAHIKSPFAKEGTVIDFELKVEHYRKVTPAQIVKTPFFDPERKRSCPE